MTSAEKVIGRRQVSRGTTQSIRSGSFDAAKTWGYHGLRLGKPTLTAEPAAYRTSEGD